MIRPTAQSELLESGETGLTRRATRDTVEFERQRHVLRRGESREEVEVLKDVTDRPTPKTRFVVSRHRMQRPAVDDHVATGWLFEAAGDREERRLSRPARAHHGNQVALIDGKVDLVVSDVVMPEMDGPTLLKTMRGKNPDLKIIFVSGYAEDAFEKSLPENQQFAFLPKPFTLAQLVAAVKETMAPS